MKDRAKRKRTETYYKREEGIDVIRHLDMLGGGHEGGGWTGI